MLQVLISTMHLKDANKLLKKMNINSDAIIVDQTDYDGEEIIDYNGYKINIYHTQERGLSKSRNYALKKSSAKYIIFADDDFEYSEQYSENIIKKYKEYPDADIIIFGAIRNDDFVYKVFPNGRLKSKYKYNINSIRITANRDNLIKSKVLFDENFGTGSKISCGEDTIFINDCFKAKLKFYSDDFIICKGIKDDRESTWWHGYDVKFFNDRGLVYKRISKFYLLLMLYFAIKKYSQYKNNVSFFNALKSMIYSRVK